MDNFYYEHETFGSLKKTDLSGNVKYDNVSFAYDNDKIVLENFSYTFNRNKIIAIVGKSGSGKSTLFNLLLRFYKPSTGEITIDGINISDIEESSYRNIFSMVRQEPYLFNMSIKENLLLANETASDEDLYNACIDAHIHDFIIKLPDQYDTVIDDMGANFSTGQRQRMAIARAMGNKKNNR